MNNSIKAAIFILTQNTVERKVYLKTTLYFLFRHFNKTYEYPIIILHQGDYDAVSQEEIIQGIRKSHRHLIVFKEMDKSDWEVPEHIDVEKVKKIIDISPVPYWRNLNYRLMCNFWMKHFHKYTNGYDYVMRLDDDGLIEEPISYDLFEMMKSKNLVYMSNIVHIDCGICNYRMKEMFEEILPTYMDSINGGLFVKTDLKPDAQPVYDKFKEILTILGKPHEGSSEIPLAMPIMYYNNFFVTSTEFWKRKEVCDTIEKIDKNGGIFYYRYGDAPLQTIIVTLLEPTKISRAVFKYSKRLQREVFIGSNGEFKSYMPSSYDESSCIVKK